MVLEWHRVGWSKMIVNELQRWAEDSDKSISQVLRRAKRVATKLNDQKTLDWINMELNGYENEADVPLYRIMLSTPRYYTNGPVFSPPSAYQPGYEISGYLDIPGCPRFNYPLLCPITEVELHSHSNEPVYFKVADDISCLFKSNLENPYIDRFTLVQGIGTEQFSEVCEQVRNLVLDWSCRLEDKHVLGENDVFSTEEQRKAVNIAVNIWNGNKLDKCQVDKYTEHGNNIGA